MAAFTRTDENKLIMRLIRGLYNCPDNLFSEGCVATIGNFDGLHLGHQAIIQRLTKKAQYLSLPSVVILFEPHPQEFFRPEQAPARLYKLTDKIQALKQLGVGYVLCLRFNQGLAQLNATSFVEQVLLETLKVKHLFIGDDFKFGYQRQGDFELLNQYDFTVEANQSVTHQINDEKLRISSSQVRYAIKNGDFELAKQMMGRAFMIEGRVAHGDKQGRLLGFPTANIALKRKQSPLKGVYAVKVYGINANCNSKSQDTTTTSAYWLPAVANVGVKPTLGKSVTRLEVHLLNYDMDSDLDLYGQRLSIEPIQKLRDEKKFDSIDELKVHIQSDVEQATGLFKILEVNNRENR